MSTDHRPAIVLVPGFMTDADLWTDFIPELDGYDIVCADTSTGTTLEEIAAHILEQCPPKFILLGFSLGGYVARWMTYQAADRVEALILVATSARSDPPTPPPSATAQAFKGLSTGAIRASLGPDSAKNADLIARIQRMGTRLGGEVFKRLSSLERPSERELLQQIRCDALVICAALDKLRSLEESQELALALDAQLTVIEDCGHMIPLEKPQELAIRILEWLKRRKAGAA